MSESVRIDKWLWAVRLYKTRTLAADACRGGQVRVNGESVKAAREIRRADLVTARTGTLLRTVRVLAVLERRVSAAEVPEYLEDLTPPEELTRPREPEFRSPAWRAPGLGRPTKRDRRRMDAWLGGSKGSPE